MALPPRSECRAGGWPTDPGDGSAPARRQEAPPEVSGAPEVAPPEVSESRTSPSHFHLGHCAPPHGIGDKAVRNVRLPLFPTDPEPARAVLAG